MEGLTRPPPIAAGADDYGTHANEHRPLEYIVGIPGVLAVCRECGAQTTPTLGNRCAECWRYELTERRLERITRMLGVAS